MLTATEEAKEPTGEGIPWSALDSNVPPLLPPDGLAGSSPPPSPPARLGATAMRAGSGTTAPSGALFSSLCRARSERVVVSGGVWPRKLVLAKLMSSTSMSSSGPGIDSAEAVARIGRTARPVTRCTVSAPAMAAPEIVAGRSPSAVLALRI